MIFKLVILLGTLGGVSLQQQCNVTPVETLRQGCRNLKNLTIFSRSRNTVVDDTTCGDLQSKIEFLKEPYFQYKMANTNNLFTLIIVDPDAPFLAKNTFFLHIIRANVPGRILKFSFNCCINEGTIVVRFQTPNPPPGSGKHRYIALVYLNQDGYLVKTSDAPSGRRNFNLAAWLANKRLCGPVAATQFRIENIVDYVLNKPSYSG